MGKTALRLIEKAALIEPVDPTADKNGVKQPAYVRKHTAVQSSEDLLAYRKCVAKKMTGTHGTRLEIREKFTEAAHNCKGIRA